MNKLDEIKEILYKELEGKCFGYKKKNGYDHLFGTSAICALLAYQRHLDLDIASIIGLFHDYSTYVTGNSFKHALRSSELVKKILIESDFFNEEEISIIVTAISNHSQKGIIQDEYSELIKDADVLHQYFQQTNAVFSEDYNRRLKLLKK
jgi:Predicted HD superfamily hydrolase